MIRLTSGRQAKEVNRLELQVKDLQMTLEQTIDKQRKSEGGLTEAGRKVRSPACTFRSAYVNAAVWRGAVPAREDSRRRTGE